MRPATDLTGKTFGYLTAQSRLPSAANGSAKWACTCRCGNKVERDSYALTAGRAVSCGCVRRRHGRIIERN